MTEVIFTDYSIKTKITNTGTVVFDIIRKKYVPLTPEEWVRQHILHYLIYDKKYPRSLIAVEKGFDVNGLKKRFDILVYGRNNQPVMIVECKSDTEKLDEKVFRQIAVYNLSWKVDYLWVTNGQSNFCCQLRQQIQLLNQIPNYSEIG